MFFNLQKNKSQILSMLDKNKFWKLHRIPHKTIQSDFQFSSQIFLNCRSKVKKNQHLGTLKRKIKKWKKIKNRKSLCLVLCGIWFRFQNCLVFSSIDSFWLILLKIKQNTQKNENFKFSRKTDWNPKMFHEQTDLIIQFYISCANFIKIGP